MSDARADDARARSIAQTEFERPLVIQAGAGTGKTSVLVARIVAWCLGPGWERSGTALRERGEAPSDAEVAERTLERVVAITFTEAAAAELEGRVATAFDELLHGNLAEGLEVGALPAAEPRRRRARALLDEFDRLRVSTIHAFCRRLLAAHPLEARVHPRFVIDARGMSRAAAAREALEAWLRAASERDDPDLARLVERGVAAPQLEEMLVALLAAAVPPDAFAEDALAPDRVRAFALRLRDALEALAGALGCSLAGLRGAPNSIAASDAVARAHALVAERGCEKPDELAALVAALVEIWEPRSLERLQKWGRGGFGGREAAALGARADAVAQAAASLHALLSAALALDVEELARLQRVLASLLRTASGRLRAAGAESFDALLRKTRALLADRPEVAARARAGIDQLLVDEFQDTDRSQCAILGTLALEPALGARPGLCLVGDPKQSIYGWRSADLRAYEEFVARVLAQGGVRHRLSVNHRSRPALLEEVQRVMALAMHEQPGLQPPFEPLLADAANEAAQRAEAGRGPSVEYWISSAWDRAARAPNPTTASRAATALEAPALARDLVRLQAEGGPEWRWSAVGILFRGGADLDVYLEALRRAGIPYTTARERSYYRRREVVDASALVRAVLDPSDQIALVATLRSAWVGVPDAAWPPLWRLHLPDAIRRLLEGRSGAREKVAAIARSAAEALREIRVPGLDRLSGWDASLLHALDVLVALRRSFEHDPAERFIEKLRTLPLLEATEGARFLGAWRLANLDRFLRELGAALEASRGDAAAVLRELRRDASRDPEFDEGRPQHPSEDAVQVMTIHGAKGLQFEHVYLLQVHKAAARARDGDVYLEGVVDGRLEYRVRAQGVAFATLGFDRVQAERNAVASAEGVRTLYVAMTRAKRRLVVAGRWDPEPGRDDEHARLLVPARGEALRRACDLVRSGPAAAVDVEGARFVFLGIGEERGETSARPSLHHALPDAARVLAEASALGALRAAARRRAQRELGGAASEKRSDELREAAAGSGAEDVAARRPRVDVEIATAVGTAIHELLERFAWSAEPEAELERQRAQLRESLARAVSPARFAGALARAERILARLVEGPLWPRLRALRSHILARELPVLVRPDEDGSGPVGYAAGAIDLIYRDPETGELVVADFKTDRIDDDSVLAGKLERYRSQARSYRRAAAEGLGLERPPRFQLWFLDAGRIVEPDWEQGGVRDPIEALVV